MRQYYGAKQETNILYTIKRRKTNWIGDMLRRNCRVKRIIKVKGEGDTEVAERQGKRRKQLLDDLEKRKENGN
jgi:hypothetical protein